LPVRRFRRRYVLMSSPSSDITVIFGQIQTAFLSRFGHIEYENAQLRFIKSKKHRSLIVRCTHRSLGKLRETISDLRDNKPELQLTIKRVSGTLKALTRHLEASAPNTSSLSNKNCSKAS